MDQAPANAESLRHVVGRVIEDGKDYARAEVEVAKQVALAKVAVLRPVAIILVAVLFLAQAALTVLVAALGLWLARWLGPAGGLAVAAAAVLLLCAILAAGAVNRLKAAF